MKIINFTVAFYLFVLAAASVNGQKIAMPASDAAKAVENEVLQFFAAYADDLRQHRREAIADRYDRGGTYFMGQGRKQLESFEAVRERYINKWKGPKAFEWRDLSVEVLSPDSVVVLGRFEWQTVDGKLFNYSYTGVLLKREGKWRIRVEDESGSEVKQPVS